MSSIHYKFRAELDYKTLQFDGLHIRGEHLVREICTKENLKLELFELQLQNAHTKKTYSDDELIPRNSSIIVQRFPRKDAAKVQKVQAGVNSGMVNQPDGASSSLDPSSHIATAEFENMDEAERLNHIRDQSTRAYDPSNFRRRPQGIMTGPPPPTYTCNRCYQPGHWYKNCPMLNTKRTTGIPSQELMETTADDPAAMLHPSGKYVVPIMHWKARQETLARKAADADGSSSPAQVDRKVPPELLCPLCQALFKEAIVTACCGNSYCAECIEQRIMDPENRKCPGADCGNTEISIESLIPNRKLRDAAAAWLSATGGAAVSTVTPAAEPEQIRIRIGLKAPPSSTAVSGLSSPGNALVPQLAVNPSIPGVTAPPIVQDVSLPPPATGHLITHELPPGIPGVGVPQFTQQPIGVPGLAPTVLQQPHALLPSFGIPVFTAGFPPAASTVPRTSTTSGFDEWNAFLRNKDRRDDKRREHRDKDRTRRKDRRDSRSRRRRDSSSSSSSSSSTSSGEDDRQRRKRREKESLSSSSKSRRRSADREQRSRRSDEHRRDRGSERDRERDRDRDSRRAKESKSRRDEPSRRRDRKRDDERKKEKVVHQQENELEDVKNDSKNVESKDEDEIDGIIAEYGNVQVQEEDEQIEKKENEEEEKEVKEEEEEEAESPKQEKEEEEEPADEEPYEEHSGGTSGAREKSPENHAMETSEAEVAESKTESEEPKKEHEDVEMEEEEEKKEKESQSSTINTADEDDDGGKKKKHKKSKKSKKHHRKEDAEEDGDDEEERKRKKHHKKHKKEKKAKKEKQEKEETDGSTKKKDRKRERDREDYDSDAPKTKIKREEKESRSRREKESDKSDKRENEKEKERKKEKREEKKEERKEKKEEKKEEKPRRSVHERLQKADEVTASSSNSTASTAPSGRKPVSFSLSTTKNRIRQYSSSSSTKEQEEEERSKQRAKKKKDETDVESVGEKEKKKSTSRTYLSSGEPGSKHKSIKIKFDL